MDRLIYQFHLLMILIFIFTCITKKDISKKKNKASKINEMWDC